MFDSHCHLDAEEYDDDREGVLARATAAGITGIMVPGYVPYEWPRLARLADPRVICAVGLHPLYVHELTAEERTDALRSLPDWLATTRARAVGECGLDLFVSKRGGADLDTQAEVVRQHLALAHELKLPIILHCVRAHARMLALLDELGPLPGVMHAYGGPAELVPEYAKRGMHFSFGGIITHANARKPRLAVQAIPRERLLVETDGPSQVPHGVERTRSEPADVARVLDVMASLRPENADELARVTEDNARSLFAC
ncbi:MAG TPA: TatD family hydrolase [Polyangiales bacterium]|nr:TatD family hydrolase [Polyangiales bacterium]